MAPEILKNDRYDGKVDVYSFGICLIAMMRAEIRVVDLFFESLRKSMKRKHLRGIGINIL
jgi:serine/threonine protein kinase